jgi:hypothetical protein
LAISADAYPNKKFSNHRFHSIAGSASPENRWFDDFANFVTLFGHAPQVDGMVTAEGNRAPILHFAWVHGDETNLKK